MEPCEFIFYVKGLIEGKYDDTAIRLKKALEEVSFPHREGWPSDTITWNEGGNNQ